MLPLRSTFAFAFATATSLLLAANACATTSDCQRQTEECLKRCETTTDDREVAVKSLPPMTTLTECESRCGCPRENTARKPPQGPPTPTGN